MEMEHGMNLIRVNDYYLTDHDKSKIQEPRCQEPKKERQKTKYQRNPK
jgi:hypothetical protein